MQLSEVVNKSPIRRLVRQDNFCEWFFQSQRCVSFINPVNYLSLQRSSNIISGVDQFFYDGLLAQKWIGFLYGKKFARLSFDNTSIASNFFRYCQENNKSLYILGALELELDNFLSVVAKEYPRLNVAGSHNGYFDETTFEKIKRDIISLAPDVVICGLGCPKQEKVAAEITKLNNITSTITCGGFIRQTQYNLNYYPYWINKFHLRMLYRLYSEPHTRSRLICYPKFLLVTLIERLRLLA